MKYSKDLHAKILIENDLRTQYVVWKARPWCIIEGTIEWCDIIVLLVEWFWHLKNGMFIFLESNVFMLLI